MYKLINILKELKIISRNNFIRNIIYNPGFLSDGTLSILKYDLITFEYNKENNKLNLFINKSPQFHEYMNNNGDDDFDHDGGDYEDLSADFCEIIVSDLKKLFHNSDIEISIGLSIAYNITIKNVPDYISKLFKKEI